MASSARELCPWFHLELEIHNVEKEWEKIIDNKGESYFSLGYLDPKTEKKCNSKLVVSGPMLHVYIKELGSLMLNKLARSKGTGVQSANSTLIPWQIMVQLMRLIMGYGGNVSAISKPHKEKVFTVTIDESCASKVFHPRRCGKNFVLRRKYTKSPTGNYVYAGCSKIAITNSTPIVLSYYTKTQKASLKFYIQRYDENGIALDAALQMKLNE